MPDLNRYFGPPEPNPLKLRPELLLHPNIPKPLHGLNPRTIKGIEWWDAERAKAYASTKNHCITCGVHKNDALFHSWLEAHEVYAINYVTGCVRFLEIVPLCHACHNFIHSGLMAICVSQGEMTQEKYDIIRHHGNTLLKVNKLRRKKPPILLAPWAEWHLLFEGKTYKSQFKSYKEWSKHYA